MFAKNWYQVTSKTRVPGGTLKIPEILKFLLRVTSVLILEFLVCLQEDTTQEIHSCSCCVVLTSELKSTEQSAIMKPLSDVWGGQMMGEEDLI